MRVDPLGKYTLEARRANTKRKGTPTSMKEREVDRLYAVLNSLPFELLNLLSIQQLMVAFKFDLSASHVTTLRLEYMKQRGKVEMAGKNQSQGDAASHGSKAKGLEDNRPQIVLERVARIVTKTYAHLGDAELVASEDALRMIHRELEQFDGSILPRNERRALPKQSPVTNNLATRS